MGADPHPIDLETLTLTSTIERMAATMDTQNRAAEAVDHRGVMIEETRTKDPKDGTNPFRRPPRPKHLPAARADRETAEAPSPSPVPPPSRPSSNYSYENVTDERIARWAATGRQEVVDHGIQSRNDVDITELSCIFQEFIRSVLDGRLPSIDAGTCIKEIIGPESSELTKNTFALEPHALFLDTLATVLEGDLTDEHPQLRFFLDATGISHQTMREMLEVSLLNQLGLIRDSFAKLGIRHATNLLYRQANYNLLREETEGYSKLITELFTTTAGLPLWERARDLHLGAFFELGGRQITEAERETLEGLDDDEVSNKTAAQLLGFKLRFYASEARDEEDVLPANLLYLAALLIKVGFISSPTFTPTFGPLTRTWTLRPGGGMNALLMAGALPDDTVPTSTPLARARETAAKQDADSQAAANAGAEEKSKLPEPMEQKVALVLCLLTIGALPEALFMLGRFPWMTDASPEVLDRIHRILNHSLHQVFKDSQPTRSSAYVECPAKDMANADQIGAPKGTVKLGKLVPRKTLRWPFPDKADTNDNQHYRFYWDEWTDNIPVCRTVDDVFTLCGSLLNVSGVNIGKDETLLPKLATIGAKSLAEDSSKENRARWLDLLKRLLLPALSMTKANSATVNAVWSLLSTYPTHVRYNLYAEWYEGQISRLPAIKAAFSRTRLETLNIMKRLSLTNLSDMAKSLAKTSYSSPGVVFKVALDQIESYANLIDAFVECAKYFTDLSYDVLVWSLMNSLGGKNRSRTQETSVLLTSKWLQALSRFAGRVFRRYSVMNPTPVIQYVDDQLFKGNSTDLIILKELISSMGGVVPSADFTDAQILAMSGGETLRRQTLISVQDKRFDSVKSSKRLIQALIDSKLAGRLLVNLVQYRQAAIYKTPEDEAHIKYLSSMIDDSNQILTQYLDLLRSNLEPSVFDSLVPAIDRLLGDFGVDVSLAFLVSRPSLSFRMMPKEEQAKAQLSQAATDDGDVSMADAAASQAQASVDSGDLDDKMEGGVGSGRINDPFLEVLQPVMDTLERIKEPTFWKAITPEFYTMFWALQLGDLYVPEEWYQKEEDRAYTQGKEIMRDRSDMTRNGITKKEEKHKALLDVVMKLGKEKASHRKAFARNKFYITRRFKTWFPAADQAKPRLVSDAILEQCLLPRLVLSAGDAEYCHRVIRFLHDFACPNFSLMSLYERLFNANRLRAIIFTCTVREVEHFGRFLKCVLSDLSRWHKDKAVYEKDALLGPQAGQKERNLHGFATAFDGEGKPTAFVEHAQFRDTLYGWHRNLNTALKSCLGGMEWMHIRNAITQFIRQLKAITERESAKPGVDHAEAGNRVDLSVAAQTALSELQKRKSKWVMVQGFRPNTSGDSGQDIAQNSNLRPTANEFKPGRAGKTSTSKGHAAAEDEDGEVKDGEDSKAKPGASNTSKDTLPPRPDAKPGLQSQGPALPERPHTDSLFDQMFVCQDTSLPIVLGKYEPRDAREKDQREARDATRTPDPSRLERPRDLPNADRRTSDHSTPRDNRDARDSRDNREARETKEARETPRHSDAERAGRNDSARRTEPHDRESRQQQQPRDRPSASLNGRGHNSPRPRDSAPATPTPASSNRTDAPSLGMNPERAALLNNADRARPDGRGGKDNDTNPRPQEPDRADMINPARAALIDGGGGAIDHPLATTVATGAREHIRRGDGTARKTKRLLRTEGATTATAVALLRRRDNRDSRDNRDNRDNRDSRPDPAQSAGSRGDKRNDRESNRHPDNRPLPGGHGAPRDPQMQTMAEDQGRTRIKTMGASIPFPPWLIFRRAREAVCEAQPAPHLALRLTTLRAADRTREDKAPTDTPTGPSSSRGRRGQFEANSQGMNPPGPSTPAPPSHSDRGRQGPPGPSPASSFGGTPSTQVGVHPDRLSQIAPPPPRQITPTHLTAATAGLLCTKARTALAGINNMLQQAQANMSDSSRSRRSSQRTNLAGSDAQILTGASPVSTPTKDGEQAIRLEAGADRGSANGDGHSGRPDDRGRRDRDRSERSGRSRRSSRERDRDRDRERDAHRDRDRDRERDRERDRSADRERDKESRNYRDRRSAPSGTQPPLGVEETSASHPDAQVASLRAVNPWVLQDPLETLRHLRVPAVGTTRVASLGGGGRDLNSRTRDDRREPRDNRGRKRRSEEGAGSMSNEREKRQRR
ncbi:unnamed protein product [Parascedosporium putredinis]|uniref:THO complex subunit 2 n=1 Tax=Parascedosporium putredinis TaxID=1442378 RepID=A0A9P1MD39_9PEZI|nr:unnamed protein product [Parascedosporium putredinis]CAI7998892.1 unnamed protein product [Parascedosporium putredinis]